MYILGGVFHREYLGRVFFQANYEVSGFFSLGSAWWWGRASWKAGLGRVWGSGRWLSVIICF